MLRFAANLSLMYTEHPFLERFAAAAQDGFKGVEFLFPYAFAPEVLARCLAESGLQQVLINAPPGGDDVASMASAFERGARGTACLPGYEAACQDCEVLIEPINPRDMPGYFLNRQEQAHAVLAQVGEPNLKVQMDLYHCQIVEGDLSTKLRHYLPGGNVGHIQIAGVPDRHEPDSGELNYPHLLALIDALGYSGWVGCEYRPSLGAVPGATRQGLGWMRAIG